MTDSETTERSGRVDDETDEDASEAQAQVIASLRAQVTDLFSQVTQLNSKLVASYDRVSDLEDQLHDASSSLRNASVTISSLELERSHHLAALNTGLLVEKAHVTTELNRLMERATEEAAQRGQAESARHDIEKDLDDLSASLFDQANTMVAEARLNQANSERKVQDAEQALKIAEDAVKDMQAQMQTLQAEKEATERDAQEARLVMGKGKWVERDDLRVGDVPRVRFMITHASYAEFIAFVVHLRGLRALQPTPPVISTLLGQSFIARLLNEDSEPTVRLDLAPSLNWLSRRSVLSAIHTGMLTVEPLPFSTLVQELYQYPQSMSTSFLSCALCGTLIARIPPTTPVSRSHNSNGNSWFKYPLALGSTQNHNAGTSQFTECEPPGQVYVFRLATSSTSPPPSAVTPVHTSSISVPAVGASSRPLNVMSSSRVLQAQTQHSSYPLCTSNYCLTRLRSTCSLWAFVRVGIVERIWEEEVAQPPKPLVNGDTQEVFSPLVTTSVGHKQTSGTIFLPASEKPPVPPRRRRLWEMASALGERAVSWGKENGENAKEREREKEIEKDSTKKLPSPPPSHPSAPHPHAESSISRVNVQDPPPLPKRNTVRDTATADPVATPSSTQDETVAAENKKPTPSSNGHIDLDKADLNALDSSSLVDETTFATPPSEESVPLPATSPPIAAMEPSAPPVRDPAPPPSPHTIPLPMTPTAPSSVSHVASPVPRPRSRLSSPASPPPPSSRPTSPAISRPRAGSPVQTAGNVRPGSPSPGHIPPVALHVWGKPSMPSPLASSRPVSPASAAVPGAPPLPKRAATRRAVPPPTTTARGDPKTAEEGVKEESPVAAVPAAVASERASEADACRGGQNGVDVSAEPKSGDGEGIAGANVVKEANANASVCQIASEPAPATSTETDPVPVKDDAVGGAKAAHGDATGAVDGTMHAGAVPDALPPPPLPPRASEGNGDGSASVHTASTKLSSSTDGDGDGFASNTTWEERTWKELVRLKEDMFWARIGGVRAGVSGTM